MCPHVDRWMWITEAQAAAAMKHTDKHELIQFTV